MEGPSVMKVEVETEACCVCGVHGEELYSPEEHDAAAPPHLPPLRAMLLHLNHSKTVPSGRMCTGCIRKTGEAYTFSTTLASKGPPPLSEKIRALRKKLHELTQKIDVFIVVGSGGSNGAYSEDDIIMVERSALAAAARADQAELARVQDLKGDQVYQCTVCPLTFQRASEYKTHRESHPPDAVHSCWTCGAQFATSEAAADHAEVHHSLHTRCHLCNEPTQSQAEFRRHLSSCPPRCPTCGAQFPSRAELSAHVSARHVLTCAACFLTCASAEELHAHRLHHRQEKQFICGYDNCILRFSNRNNLVSHIRKCHGQLDPSEPQADVSPSESASAPASELVPCPHCTRTFATTAAMKRHAHVHKQHNGNKHKEDVEWTMEETEFEDDGKVEYLEVETLEEMEEDSLQS